MYLRKRTVINDVLVCPVSASNVTITVQNMTDPVCVMISYPISHVGIPGSIPGVGLGSHIVFSKRLKQCARQILSFLINETRVLKNI